jgi:hypothetical protein
LFDFWSYLLGPFVDKNNKATLFNLYVLEICLHFFLNAFHKFLWRLFRGFIFFLFEYEVNFQKQIAAPAVRRLELLIPAL